MRNQIHLKKRFNWHCFLALLFLLLAFPALLLAQHPDTLNERAWKLKDTYPDSAKRLALQALSLAHIQHDDTAVGDAHARLAVILNKQGKTKGAEIHALQSAQIRLDLGDTKGVAAMLNTLVSIYREQRDFQKAMQASMGSLRIRSMLGDSIGMAKAFNNLSSLHEEMENYDQAKEAAENALALSMAVADTSSVMLSLKNLGIVAFRKEKYQDAIDLYWHSADYFPNEDNLDELGDLHLNLGLCFIEWGKLDSAIIHLEQAYGLYSKLEGQLSSLADVYNNLGMAHERLDKAQRATTYYQQGLAIGQDNMGEGTYMDLLYNSAHLEASMGNQDAAYQHLSEYSKLRELHFQEEGQRDVLRLETEYQVLEKNLQISKLENDQLVQQAEAAQRRFQFNSLMVASALLLVIAILIVVLLRRNARQRVQERERQLQTAKEAHQRRVLDLLRTQEIERLNGLMEGQDKERTRIASDLHDRLGSLLATLKLQLGAYKDKALLPEAETKVVDHLMEESIREMREISHNLSTGVLGRFGLVPAVEELANTLNRSGPLEVRLHLHDMEERLEEATEIQLFRIIQELTSNVIRHAQATKLTLQFTRTERLLNLMVEDNGRGYDTQLVEVSKGMGLANVQSRVGKMGGTMETDTRPGRGTLVIIDIPL